MCAETQTSLLTSLVASSAVTHGFGLPAKASPGAIAGRSKSQTKRRRITTSLQRRLPQSYREMAGMESDFRVKGRLPCRHQLRALGSLAVVALDVVVEDLLELGYNRVAVEGLQESAVDVDWRFGLLEGSWQA